MDSSELLVLHIYLVAYLQGSFKIPMYVFPGQTKYFKLGGTLKLEQGSPPPPGSSITWKFQSNKVIEYDPNFTEDIDVYGDFKNRATLNKATGQLETTDLTKKDSGVYTLEVNSEVNATYTVAVIRKCTCAYNIIAQ